MESTRRIRANIRVQDACQEQALLQYEKDILTEAAGSLREGEVVPVLEASGAWLRVEDNPGARGWAHSAEVRRLDAPPGPPRD